MKPSDLGFCTCQDWYDPCDVGVHVCGRRVCDKHTHGPDEVPTTEFNVPCASDSQARQLFDSLKAEFEDEDGDLLVDLMQGDCSIEDDFYIRRQMLDRLKTAVLAKLEPTS